MSVDKKVNYDVQGGVKNYLGKQQQVKAPLKWKSSPDSPETELAYITKAEKDLLVKQDLHGSLQGGVNRGPSGIMSLDGWGSTDESQNVSGAAASAAESGSSNERDRAQVRAEMSGPGPALPPGVTPQTAQDFRNEFIAAGGGQRVNPGFFDDRNTVSPAELAAAKAYDRSAFSKNRRGGIMDFITSGGFLGNIIRGLGQKFGLGKKYNEPTYDMRKFSNVNPTYYNNFDNELMLSTEEKPTQTFNFDNLGMVPSNLNNLDLNKLEAADLNNIQSLLDASTNQYPTKGIMNQIPPDFMRDSPQFLEGIDNSMYGGDRRLFGSDENQKYYTGDVIPTFGEVYESEADGITNYDFDDVVIPTDEEIAARRFP
jgi:hypothetical protein